MKLFVCSHMTWPWGAAWAVFLKANETLNNSAEEFNGFKGSNVEDNIPQERLPNEQSE